MISFFDGIIPDAHPEEIHRKMNLKNGRTCVSACPLGQALFGFALTPWPEGHGGLQ